MVWTGHLLISHSKREGGGQHEDVARGMCRRGGLWNMERGGQGPLNATRSYFAVHPEWNNRGDKAGRKMTRFFQSLKARVHSREDMTPCHSGKHEEREKRFVTPWVLLLTLS